MEFKPEKKDEILAKRRKYEFTKALKKLSAAKTEKQAYDDNSPLAKRLKLFKEQQKNQL